METPHTAVVVYSFGGSSHYGAGPANEKLARIASRVAREADSVVIAQDYLEEPLGRMGCRSDLVIREHRQKGHFLGTEEVTEQAALYLQKRGIRRVFLIAHPFLHRPKCKKLLCHFGFSVECVRTGYVPFDPRCEFWWVRSSLHLLFYAVLQALFKRQGR